MVTILFPDRATEKRALEFLLGRFSGRVLRSGEHLVPEAALEALAELQPGELALFQVLWQPVQNPWAESIINSVTLPDGKKFRTGVVGGPTDDDTPH
mgnify:CR=1 FL=1